MKTLPNFFKKKPVLSKIKTEEPIFKEQVLATKKTEIKEVKTIVPANKRKRKDFEKDSEGSKNTNTFIAIKRLNMEHFYKKNN